MSPGRGVVVVVHTAVPSSISSCSFPPKTPTVVSLARRLPRVRWHLVFFVIVSLSATTAFSTTFPLKSSSSGSSTLHPINVNGLPSKILFEADSSVATEQDEESTARHKSIATESTNLIPSTTTTPSSTFPETEVKESKSTDDVNKDDDDDNNMATLPDDEKFKERIKSSLRTVQSWETVEWIKDCRAIIPWKDLCSATGPFSRPEEDRALVEEGANAIFLQRFCRWFPKIMAWVNAPPCVVCGSKDCEMKTVRGPETEEEIEGNAKRVEVYYCPKCNENTTTFPRYNKARKLLDTRKGRCGEYSNLFGLFCRAVGFETRLVLDLSDHLWTEVRLGDTWIMADPCEGIIDKPSMYEYGWGKKGLSYMIALGLDHVCDVTPRYTREFLTNDFQTRRREHTTSENSSAAIIHQINMEIRKNTTLSMVSVNELERRRLLEESELHLLKQVTEWTEQEKYGRGRISGSLAWKQARSEAGTSDVKSADGRQVAGFEVESFSTSPQTDLSLMVHPLPSGRHDGIVVGGTACAIGETNSLSIVVVDERHHGCILQSRSFLTWKEANTFVNGLPSQRIVIMNGKCTDDSTKFVEVLRLGGWRKDVDVAGGIAFIGQMDFHPDWAFFSTLADCPRTGYEVVLNLGSEPSLPLKLRTERHVYPRRVVGRLPDSAMPLKTQLLATDHQKRLAFTSFVRSSSYKGYSGYVTKAGSPVYLLNSSSFPLSKVDSSLLEVFGKEKAWNTFHFLPEPLVPSKDEGMLSNNDEEKVPAYEIPLETSFFNKTLGLHLSTSSGARLPIHEALYNSRLVGLYFSAHWCGPCRSFTPMLAEMYAHLKEHKPSHGLEIVFVSGDRDEASFMKYFQSMPWLAIPFDQLQAVKASLNMTYGVRGIPSLVILDAVSGDVVVPANESRQAVGMACRGGEHQIENLLETWLQRSPLESKEILSMLELSCHEPANVEKQKDTAENSYLVAEPLLVPSHDTASRIKTNFEKLVVDGISPTSAAAMAIEMVAEEQKIGRKFDPGALSGKALKAGKFTPNSSLQDSLAFAVKLNSPLLVLDALKVTAKYVGNAMKEPWSSKFRSFKLSNQVADKITRLEGGLAVLQQLGFEISGTVEEFRATIPMSADLEEMQKEISRLIDSVNSQR